MRGKLWLWAAISAAGLVFLIGCVWVVRSAMSGPRIFTIHTAPTVSTSSWKPEPVADEEVLPDVDVANDVLPSIAAKKPTLAVEQTVAMPKFPMSLAADRWGNVWIGTEGEGVWCYSPGTGDIARFSVKDGLGDECGYAMAVDKHGRVWVGHLDHGVSVFAPDPDFQALLEASPFTKRNSGGPTLGGGAAAGPMPTIGGAKPAPAGDELAALADPLAARPLGRWQNYEAVAGLSRPDSLAGPMGERVFDIAVNPADGDVWIATDAGLARYSEPKAATGQWRYYGRAEGLPADQVQALAFGADGTLYAGMQCDGIAVAAAADDYRTWRNIRGSDRLPSGPVGEGLPTNLINDVLVARDGTVYAATTTGLAWSSDRGLSWRYVRGADWKAKADGLYRRPGAADARNVATMSGSGQGPRFTKPIPEDYVTCLAEDGTGTLWIGQRQRGYGRLNPKTGAWTSGGGGEYVTAFALHDDKVFVGTYNDGGVLTDATPAAPMPAVVAQQAQDVSLPAAAQPRSSEEWTEVLERIRAAMSAESVGPVAELPDDWHTRGDWLGRYGRYWCTTTAQDYDYLWGVGEKPVGYIPRIGSNCTQGDSLRFWIHGVHSTSDQRALEMPPVYLHSRVLRGEANFEHLYRRQAEHDDHGEAYSMMHEGPNLYYSLRIPAGTYVLSLYTANKDGHAGTNRMRDYRYSVRPFAGQAEMLVPADPQEAGRSRRAGFVTLEGFDDRPEYARGRLRDFWYGAYKRFVVRGPIDLTVEMSRSWSYNTINAGVFLDEVSDEFPDAYYGPGKQPGWKGESGGDLRLQVLAAMSELAGRNPSAWAREYRTYPELMRALQADARHGSGGPAIASAYASAAYHAGHFADWERQLESAGLTTSRQVEKSLRWDQKTFACTGKGRQLVSHWVQRTGP